MNSYLLSQEQCPQCKKLGKDTSKDNLAVYSDGHKHCYGCGYTLLANKMEKFKHEFSEKPSGNESHNCYLPSDCTTDFSLSSIHWVEQYGLTKTDLLNNNCLWSEKYQRLIFPVYGHESLLAWQGRYFGNDKKEKKWYGRGDLKNTYHILGTNRTKLILTEDIISAIKVSAHYQAMPLFGSHIGLERFRRLYTLLGKETEVCIWLDPDKRKESLKEGQIGALTGLNTRVVFSDKDPKELDHDKIVEILS